MLHLVWETTKVKQGAHWRVAPSYAVVDVTHIVQRSVYARTLHCGGSLMRTQRVSF